MAMDVVTSNRRAVLGGVVAIGAGLVTPELGNAAGNNADCELLALGKRWRTAARTLEACDDRITILGKMLVDRSPRPAVLDWQDQDLLLRPIVSHTCNFDWHREFGWQGRDIPENFSSAFDARPSSAATRARKAAILGAHAAWCDLRDKVSREIGFDKADIEQAMSQ